MKIKIHFAVMLAIFALLIGCATAPSGTYSLSQLDMPAEQTALIRPAKAEEKQFKPSAAAKIFLSASEDAQLMHIWPSNDLNSGVSLREHASVRVAPGAYLVKAFCDFHGIGFTYDFPIEAHAGKEYLIECTGNNPAGSNITVREVTPAG